METSGVDILNRVLGILEQRRIKQKDFFTKIGLHAQTPSHWKRGASPSIEAVTAMATELNVSIDWLVKGEGVEDPSEETSPAHIVNRIEDRLEEMTHHKPHDTTYPFYSALDNIVTAQELNNWREGKTPLNTVKLCAIADRIGVSVQFLMTGDDISEEEYNRLHGKIVGKYGMFYQHFYCLDDNNQKLASSIIAKLHSAQREEYREKQEFEELDKKKKAIINGEDKD